jgi:hypothetical protein
MPVCWRHINKARTGGARIRKQPNRGQTGKAILFGNALLVVHRHTVVTVLPWNLEWTVNLLIHTTLGVWL